MWPDVVTVALLSSGSWELHATRCRQVRGRTKHVCRQLRGPTKHASDRCVVPRSTLQTGAWSHEACFRVHEARFRTCTKHASECTKHASDRCVVARSTLQTGAWSHEARFRQVRGPTKHFSECTKHASELARSTPQTGAWSHEARFRQVRGPTKHASDRCVVPRSTLQNAW